jgi:hypothetical protein
MQVCNFLAQAEEKKAPEELGDRPIFAEKMQDVDVCQGGEAVFSVRASDSPKIEWYRGDKQIENKGRFTIQEAKDGGNVLVLSGLLSALDLYQYIPN